MVAALTESHEDGVRVLPRVSGGRYGLSSKEFTPGMVAGVFEELASERPRRHFTVGITDDVSGTSLTYDASLDIDPPNTVRAVFFGLGADGTVGANKNTIKILGAEENLYAQGYFVYDSKKSGSQTVSHLRFGPQPIRAPSSLIRHGPGHATVLLDGLAGWMARKGYASVDDVRGLLAVPAGTDQAAYERAGYVRAMRDANGAHRPW